MTEAPTFSPSLRPYDRDRGQAGLLVPSHPALGIYTSSAGVELIANRKYGVRVVPSRDMRIVKVGIQIAAVEGSSGNSAMDVGIFDGTGQTLLGSSGPTTGVVNSIGWKHLTLTTAVTLKAGTTYYAALATAATFTGTGARPFSVFPANQGGEPFGLALGLLEYGIQTTAGGTLAAPFNPGSSGSVVPVFCLRET